MTSSLCQAPCPVPLQRAKSYQTLWERCEKILPEMSVTLIAVARGNFSLRIWVTLSSPSVCEANIRWAQWRRGSCHTTKKSWLSKMMPPPVWPRPLCRPHPPLPCQPGPRPPPAWPRATSEGLHGVRCPHKLPRTQNQLLGE